jgi:REP element-mobilizing transposase RayT
MSRPLRIEYEGAWYHVMNRGRRSDRIFEGQDDYQMFIEVLKDAIELWDIRISAYCLMSNHYHLLIHTPKGNLSRCMRHINGVYTQRFNRTHGLDGQLFRGRYKSIIVDGDSYLLQLVRYIHRNPLRAGVADAIHEYPWSSHSGYLSSAKKWSWLHKDFIFSLLSNAKAGQLKAYKAFMNIEDSEEITRVFEGNKRPVALGNEKFVRWLKGKFFVKNRNPQVPESLALAPEIEEIKSAVCLYYKVDEFELLISRRGRFSEPRSMAIYLARMLRKDSLLDIGSEFALNGYSSVSSVLEGMKKQLQKNRQLRKRYKEVEETVLIGQTET